MKTVKVTTANIEWEVLPVNSKRSNPPHYRADLGDTTYWIKKMHGGKWSVEDNHGAVWGSFSTAEEAMTAVEAHRGYL